MGFWLNTSPVLIPCQDDPSGEHNYTKDLDLRKKKLEAKLIVRGWRRCENCGSLANKHNVKEIQELRERKARKRRAD